MKQVQEYLRRSSHSKTKTAHLLAVRGCFVMSFLLTGSTYPASTILRLKPTLDAATAVRVKNTLRVQSRWVCLLLPDYSSQSQLPSTLWLLQERRMPVELILGRFPFSFLTCIFSQALGSTSFFDVQLQMELPSQKLAKNIMHARSQNFTCTPAVCDLNLLYHSVWVYAIPSSYSFPLKVGRVRSPMVSSSTKLYSTAAFHGRHLKHTESPHCRL